jgi:hypothetical protein
MCFILLLLLSASSPGCLWLAAGAAAGTAVAGYAYARGRLYRDYPVGMEECRKVTQDALHELNFPVSGVHHFADGSTYETQTGDGTPVTVELERQGLQLSGEPTTRVGVRVGVFGHEDLSKRILDQINLRLVPCSREPPPAPPPVTIGPIKPTAKN